MPSDALQGPFLDLPVDGGIYLDAGCGNVVYALLLKYGPEIIRFKLFTDIVENDIQSVSYLSLFKGDLLLFGLQILLLGDEVHFSHGRKHIVLPGFGQLPRLFFFCFCLFGERVVSEWSFYGAGNEGGFNQIQVFCLFVKKILGRNSETSAKTGYKELVDIHL